MSTITTLFEQAQLAEAAYADLTGAIGNQDALQIRLDVANKSTYNGSFSATQAADFAQRYQVVSQLPNTTSGFSATVFLDKTLGVRVNCF
jgi:hypothetical protein